jgi:hypothetical protein
MLIIISCDNSIQTAISFDALVQWLYQEIDWYLSYTVNYVGILEKRVSLL